ncbi:AarF/UbiB family protein [Candidatus Accumulibacter sp. ACC012]|uniref:AarF/UbiB family protein n=1 Tax=Candidatus Accumulibacter sp. ACC012 TaxID=2823332 RepID=UPI0025B916B6|nr:AarF/UbiB family protein [Candidatus Accumulibacter sp. ACC012]
MTLHSNIDQHSGALALLLPLTELLPENYAPYRPLLADGLAFFLQRLSPDRQQAIVAAQIELPRSASRERRVISLFRLCPTLHKLGQVVAHDRRLSADLRQRLQELETLAPTDSLAAVQPLLDREVGPVAGLQLGQETIAEGSVAVVVPFVWQQAQDAAPQRGVFKVLRPGVQERLEEELAIWPLLGTFLEERCAHHGLPVLDYANTLETVARLLANEVRLDQEQEHLRQAADFYAASPDILIPRLFPFCTPLVTAMERVDGCKVTHQDLPAAEMRQRAERVIRALLAQPFWGSGETGAMFHADPHAGNLLATPDGRLAIIDWALTTRLTKAQCEAVVQLGLGAVTLNETRVCRAIAALGQVVDEARVRLAVGAAIEQVRAGRFPGFDWMTSLLDSLAASSAVRFPEEIALFRKALLTLSGVAADVSEHMAIDRVLVRHGAGSFLQGLLRRPWAWADSRAVGGHLSTVDLVGLCVDLPATTLRFLAGDRSGSGGLAGRHAVHPGAEPSKRSVEGVSCERGLWLCKAEGLQ